MRALLLEHNIVVDEHDAIIGYEDFTFLPNARIRTPENDVISAIQFMHDYV